jgi:hypothetical protein
MSPSGETPVTKKPQPHLALVLNLQIAEDAQSLASKNSGGLGGRLGLPSPTGWHFQGI